MTGRLRLLTALAIVLLVTACWSVRALAGLASGIRVLESDDSGITLELDVDSFTVRSVNEGGRTFQLVELAGFPATDEEGLPRLPYTYGLVAVPFGKNARARVLVNETAVIPGVVPLPASRAFIRDGELPVPAREFAIDESFYGGASIFPSEIVRLGQPATLRHQRVLSVHLFPFRYAPASGELVQSKRLVVRVDFESAGRLEQIRETNVEPAPSFELYSEGLYQGLLLNYEEARAWRMKPSLRLAETVLPLAQAADQYKIRISSAGIYKVPYSSVPGLSSTHTLDQVRLFEKSYLEGDPSPFREADVPVHIVDVDSNGYFDGSDYFVFYGLGFRDRFPVDSMEARYTNENVYWLTVGGSPGSSMSERDSWPAQISPQPAQSFLHVQRVEKDSLCMTVPPREAMDYYFWKDPLAYDVSIPFPVYAPDTTKAWRVRARYQGLVSALHYVSIIIRNSRGVVDTLFYRSSFGPTYPTAKAEMTFDAGFSVPDTLLASGSNTFRYIGEREQVGILYQGSGAYLDWFEVSYYKRYVASGGVLAFNSGTLSGELEFALTGFPSRGILLYDVTDSLTAVRLTIGDSQITPDGAGYRLMFRDSIGVLPKRFVAIVTESLPSVPGVELDARSTLATSGISKDYFIVTYDAFAPLLTPLASHREAQGHGVEVAKLSDVFDEFNGGRRSARAIKRYMKYAFQTWGTPLFLFLVGDASEDYKGLTDRSRPDFLPTYLILSPVVGPAGKELVASDQWYVTGLDGVLDDYPDMYVGRITAGSPEELSAFVAKVIAYETFSSDQSFRGRGLFLSDDAYSSLDMVYDCPSSGEAVFQTISIAASDVVNESPAAPGFQAESFFLSSYLDTFPGKPGCVLLGDVRQFTRANATPALMSKLSTGALFVNYQGHANQSLATHELLFSDAAPYNDVALVNNYGKPAFWAAFSCHFGDFDSRLEGTQGDCLAEKLVLLSNRGAIGAFSSVAFELLPLNIYADMNFVFFDAFFGSPPTVDLRGQRGARWILGELVTAAKIRYLAGDYLNQSSVRTYHLLGDPGLRMDALPPQFSVAVNDSLVSEGASVYVSSQDDSLRISAYLNDEVAVDESSIWISESGTEGRGTIPSGEYTVTALADTVSGTSRKFHVYFPTALRPATYDIELRAADVNQRESLFRLRAALNVSFSDGNGRAIRDGAFVFSEFVLRAFVSSPVVLSQGELSLLVDGLATAASAEQIDPSGRNWLLEAEVGLSDGQHELSVSVNGVSRSVAVSVASGFQMFDVFCYPSPFNRVTSFNYTLTGSPVGVTVEIFTVSGSKILELDGDSRVGNNSLIWEGRDSEGHRVANGLYLYKITATDIDGRKISKLDKIVKVE